MREIDKPDLKKTILLLGASADQLFAIRTAKKMGLRTLVVDMNPSSPGFMEADDYAVISTRDVPALIKFIDDYIAKGEDICGVLVMGSDIPQVVCALAEHIGTPHIPMEAAILSTHKFKMKRRFREFDIPIPWFSHVESVEQLKKNIIEKGYPLVLKPVDRSGARGVFYIQESSNLEALFVQSQNYSFSGEVMVEEFLSGLQISTESIMYKGKAYTPGFADRNYEKLEEYAPNIIENGAWVPSCLSTKEKKAVESLVEKAALALGVTNGVVKGDVVLTSEGPKMIEMATRLSGGDFSESLIPLGSGINIVEAAINIALGCEPDLDKLYPSFQKWVVNRYFFPPPGRLINVVGEKKVREQSWVKKLEFWYKPGDIIPPIKSHADRFGVFIVVGNSREEVENRASWVYENIKINIDTTHQ